MPKPRLRCAGGVAMLKTPTCPSASGAEAGRAGLAVGAADVGGHPGQREQLGGDERCEQPHRCLEALGEQPCGGVDVLGVGRVDDVDDERARLPRRNRVGHAGRVREAHERLELDGAQVVRRGQRSHPGRRGGPAEHGMGQATEHQLVEPRSGGALVGVGAQHDHAVEARQQQPGAVEDQTRRLGPLAVRQRPEQPSSSRRRTSRRPPRSSGPPAPGPRSCPPSSLVMASVTR